MFEQSKEEQVETLAHETGHMFGLRHFFAPDSETPWPSVIFGEHKPFSIMNYGEDSKLTKADRKDLTLLYESAWSRKLKKINGTPIKLIRPYYYLFTGPPPNRPLKGSGSGAAASLPEPGPARSRAQVK